MRYLFAWKIGILLTLCGWLWVSLSTTEPIPDWRKGELYVALPPSSMEVETAFEQELLQLFSARTHIKIKSFAMGYDKIPEALTHHKIHFASASLRSDNSRTDLKFSTPYQTVEEYAVCRKELVQRLSDLSSFNIEVTSESNEEWALRSLISRLPNLHWTERTDLSNAGLLQAVAENMTDCTVANEEQVSLARNFYPQLNNTFNLNSPSQLSWAFPADADTTLYNAVQGFIASIKKDGTLSHVIDRHFGHNERLESVNATAFLSSTRTDLENYRLWFEEAEKITGIEWHLIAALAYQESHWNPLATSYTNVRGMMMLTEDTAQRMGVEDRLDARASIIAGAKYLLLLKNSLPNRINDKERTWMALAAYNQGMGHLEDARVLTAKAGLNPDVWSDVRKMMPLLSRPAYYEQTKHGQARGGEAVILVETVRLYHDILNRLEQKELSRLPPHLAILLLHHKKISR